MNDKPKSNAAVKLSTWTAQQRGRAAAIARHLKVTPPVVSDWCSGKKSVAAEQCPLIEELTGITCEELRPDVRWDVLRNPQAATAQGV